MVSDLAFADRLRQSVNQFKQIVSLLQPAQFDSSIDGGWSPRDVMAHLIGWNSYTMQGCQQIVMGQLPFYLADEVNDFRNVNEQLLRRYANHDRSALFEELETSLSELEHVLTSLTPEDWEGSYPNEPWSRSATIRREVLALADGYETHGESISRWAQDNRS